MKLTRSFNNQRNIGSVLLVLFLLLFYLVAKPHAKTSVIVLWSLPVLRNLFFTIRFNGKIQKGFGFYWILISSAIFLLAFGFVLNFFPQ